jgi:hypothetical protein
MLDGILLVSTSSVDSTYLDGADIGVLCDVLVLIKSILGELSLLLFDGQLDQENHNRLEGRDGDISGALGRDVLVEEG